MRPDGCALCGSTWGDAHTEVEGTRLFFCCELCASQVRRVAEAIRTETGWPAIDALEFEGNRYGREARAIHDLETARYWIRFDVEGQLTHFERISAA